MFQRSPRAALLSGLLAIAWLAPGPVSAGPPMRSATEDLVVAMPAGEETSTLWRFTRTPHSRTQPVIYFSAPDGVTEQDRDVARRLADNGSWVVILDLEKLPAEVKDEAGFESAVAAVARAMKTRMSEVVGPRLKDQPERTWPFTFAGRGEGAVRAVRAAVAFQRAGKVRGVMMIEPAAEAPGIGAGAPKLELTKLFPDLGVAPVAFVVAGETETVQALEKNVIGYNGVRASPELGLEFISMHYPIRNQRAPRKGPPAFNPADLFRPGP